uniref:Small ribosomal subunit protein uS4c n=1 Tax=Gastrodia flexistyla TaxID=2974002 RepID=A0A976UFA3_9ASPA|nr:ribosomal protein S4 [Gastrodia flexistyla]UVG40851.1 ribosomal protein S4 [Gastrodia flexistyla]
MSRYRGPRLKIIYRLGALSGLSRKKHISTSDKKRRIICSVKKSQYFMRLIEKQKLRFYYGLTEQKLYKYVQIAVKVKSSTGIILLKILEMRLDNIIFRLGLASTIPEARQLVNHRHILVNGHIIDIPSYICKPRDIIINKNKLINNYNLISSTLISLPNHLSIDSLQLKGFINKIIDSKEIGIKINELLVVEYYSKKK